MDVKTLAIQNQWVEGRPPPQKIWPSTASDVVPPTSILREKWWYYFMSSYFLVDVPFIEVFKSQIRKTSVGLFVSCANTFLIVPHPFLKCHRTQQWSATESGHPGSPNTSYWWVLGPSVIVDRQVTMRSVYLFTSKFDSKARLWTLVGTHPHFIILYLVSAHLHPNSVQTE